MLKFLNLKPEMLGMDISDSSVKILKLNKKKLGSFQIESFGEVELEPGVVEAGEIKNQDALVNAIKKVYSEVKGKKLNTKYVVASLPEEKSFLEVISMPVMKKEELASAIMFEAENYVPLSIDQVYLDFQIIPTDKKDVNHLDVLIVAMPKPTVDAYSSCIKKAGLVPCVLDIESHAIARALVKDEISLQPLIIVNFGKKNSNFAIYNGQSIRFTSSVTVSSSQITEAIAKEMGVSLQEAEKIKINFSLLKREESEENKRIYRAILPVLNDLAIQIKKYFSYYRDHVSHEHVHVTENVSASNEPKTAIDNKLGSNIINRKTSDEKIILTGGGSNLSGLSDFISRETLIKTELGNIFMNVPIWKNKKNMENAKKITSSFCTSVGLALRGVNKKDD